MSHRAGLPTCFHPLWLHPRRAAGPCPGSSDLRAPISAGTAPPRPFPGKSTAENSAGTLTYRPTLGPRTTEAPMAAPGEPCVGQEVSAPAHRAPFSFSRLGLGADLWGCDTGERRHPQIPGPGSEETYSSPLTARVGPLSPSRPPILQLCLKGHQTTQLLGALKLIYVKLVGHPCMLSYPQRALIPLVYFPIALSKGFQGVEFMGGWGGGCKLPAF